jgi:prophage regulatory protein
MQTSDTQFLRLGAVCELTKLSKASVYRYISNGAFPRPARLGTRAVRWLQAEVEAWAAERVAARCK